MLRNQGGKIPAQQLQKQNQPTHSTVSMIKEVRELYNEDMPQ